MRFSKMHGAGNDYIYVNAMQEHISDPAALAVKLSDRHFGIGADGLVVIMSSERADFRMRMYNSDGTEAEMCGNASRCVGKFVFDKGLTKKTSLTLETKAGLKKMELTVENGMVDTVCVDMGEPILQPSLIPVAISGEYAIRIPLTIDQVEYEINCVSMGNPHAVIFTKEIDALNLQELGPKFELNKLFPKRINTEFVEVLDQEHVKMRVWERGAGETLACGTGACAVLVAGVLSGRLKRKAVIDLRGGSLRIEWNAQNNHVFMTGEAVTVFEGEV